MAHLQEASVTITVSKLLKTNQKATDLLTKETITSLEAVVQELVGENVLVEIEVK